MTRWWRLLSTQGNNLLGRGNRHREQVSPGAGPSRSPVCSGDPNRGKDSTSFIIQVRLGMSRRSECSRDSLWSTDVLIRTTCRRPRRMSAFSPLPARHFRAPAHPRTRARRMRTSPDTQAEHTTWARSSRISFLASDDKCMAPTVLSITCRGIRQARVSFVLCFARSRLLTLSSSPLPPPSSLAPPAAHARSH